MYDRIWCLMKMVPHILIVEEDDRTARGFISILQKKGFQTEHVRTEREILDVLDTQYIAMVLLSMDRGDNQGAQLIRTILKQAPQTICIALTAQDRASDVIRILEAGAFDCFTRPIRDWPRFLGVCTQAVSTWERTQMREEQRSHMQNLQQHKSIEGLSAIKGNSPSVRSVMDMIRLIAPLRVSTLISGESGVGKELVARAIHDESPQKRAPFLAINCVAIQPDLFESELFGHEKGAFTGAYAKKDGLCAQAGKGTLFLDEIGDLPLRLQPKLLRLLEQKTFRPVGSTQTIPFQARVICATHVNMRTAVKEGRFRKDLYFRISAQEIFVPPLRDRKDDIKLLAYTFIEKYNRLCARNVQSISQEALRKLEAHSWQENNVRELEREIQRAIVLARDNQVITKEMIFAQAPIEESREQKHWLDWEYARAQKYNKKMFLSSYLQHKLACAQGNKSKAAQLSGLASPNFHRLLRQLETMDKEEDSE